MAHNSNVGFDHASLNLPPVTVVFTAMSRNMFHRRVDISRFVFSKGLCPANTYMSFDYDFYGLISKERIMSANNSLLGKADELWVFEPVSDGVVAEILMFNTQKRPVRFYKFADDNEGFAEASISDMEFEPDVMHMKGVLEQLLKKCGSDRSRDGDGSKPRGVKRNLMMSPPGDRAVEAPK